MKSLWLVILIVEGGYVVHSVHSDRETAMHWRRCKEHEGESCDLCEMREDEILDVQSRGQGVP